MIAVPHEIVPSFPRPEDGILQDRFGRIIRYLRVSLTEHCNFKCQYCSPEEGTPYFARPDHLRPEELDTLITLFFRLGLRHVRFTGGEPLIYPWLEGRLAHARALGIPRISISTNGLLLDRWAAKLGRYGVDRVNVSLDTLDPDRFTEITRGGDLARVLKGLAAVRAVGIPDVKLNVVLLKSKNFDFLDDLVEYGIRMGFHLQFIETMPLGQAGSLNMRDEYVPVAEARIRIAARYPMTRLDADALAGPARRYRLHGTATTVGFISPISDNFCSGCNRLRLTATGRVVYCLGQEGGVDMLPLLREGTGMDELTDILRARVWNEKPERHFFNDDPGKSSRVFMMRLGG